MASLWGKLAAILSSCPGFGARAAAHFDKVARSGGRRPGRALRARLELEELEPRCVPARLGTPFNDTDDTIAEAINVGSITTGRSVRRSASLGFPTDVDMYRFSVAAGTTVEIIVQARNTTDPFLRLFDRRGNELAFNDDGPVPNQQPSFSAYLKYDFTTQGTYYVGISGFPNMRYAPVRGTEDGEGSTGPYSLIIRAVPPPGPPGGGGGDGGGTPPSQFNITLRFSGLTQGQQQIFQQAARRWEQIIIGDVPDVVFQGQPVDDILIDAVAVPIDGVGGILGQAGPRALRLPSFLPIHAVMEFDTADLGNMESSGQLKDVVLHEMGHALGFGTIWDLLGLLSGAGTSNPRFIGQQATQQYQQIFSTNQTSVPVEAGGGPGTRDSHWRESVFRTELMTGWAEPPGTPMPLSRITAASMADLGYVVNLNAADPYSPPGNLQGPGGGSGGGSGGGGAPLRIARAAYAPAKQVAGVAQISRVVSLTMDDLSSYADNGLAHAYSALASEEISRPLWRRRD